MKCRHCDHNLEHTFLDLGFSPPSNAYLSINDLKKTEYYFPLKLHICEKCYLVQTEDYVCADELFSSNYAYFSSISKGWLKHAKNYVEMITEKLKLTSNSFVIEIASNDGYLLKNFIRKNIPCLGIEPTHNTANVAEQLGIPLVREFFGNYLAQKLAREGKKADLIIGNNVYAHVPDINDFTKGLKQTLKNDGIITLEFPHIMQLIKKNQFDTVYHEHFSYLSLVTVKTIFEVNGLKVFNVEELNTHGGSLRIYGCHKEDNRKISDEVLKLIETEKENGIQSLQTYLKFQQQADKVKNNLLAFLIEQKKQNQSVVAYGAAAKGNTILNYAGVKPDLLSVVLDAAPSKQGKYLPGSHIPILSPDKINKLKPDWVLVLPWNIIDEVKNELKFIQDWGGKFVTAIPEITIYH